MQDGGDSNGFNLGNGSEFSIREVIKAAQRVTQQEIKVIERDRRAGDPPVLVGSSEKARKVLDWQPQYAALKQILAHAWRWHQQRHQ